METLDNNAVSILWDMESKRRLWSVATIRFPPYVLVLYSDHAGGLVVAVLCRSYRWMFGTNSMIILCCVWQTIEWFTSSDVQTPLVPGRVSSTYLSIIVYKYDMTSTQHQ